MRKWTSTLLAVLLGLVVFYTLVGAVLLPAALVWAVRTQGPKILGAPVALGAATVNPFWWRITLRNFSISNAENLPVVGWDRLLLDISALALLRRELRVEALRIEGLEVNAALLKGGTLNLLELIPKPAAETRASPAATPVTMPAVVVEELSVSKSVVRFIDRTVAPWFTVETGDIDIKVTGFSTRPGTATHLAASGRIDRQGQLKLEAMVWPFSVPLRGELAMTLDQYALPATSPYVGKYTGRVLKDGELALRVDLRLEDNRITAAHHVLVQRFTFGEKISSPDALPLPFGLAVALLEDPRGRIKIDLPLSGDVTAPDFHYWPLVGRTAWNFLSGIVTKPFVFLVSSLASGAGVDAPGYVRFAPGSALLTEEERARMTPLLQAFAEHPKLYLEINGAVDPATDWRAIREAALQREYDELRQQSRKSDVWVQLMVYQRHFGLRDQWALSRSFRGKNGQTNEAGLIAEARQQLLTRAPVDRAALDALAAARAAAVSAYLEKAGFDARRMIIGPAQTAQGGIGYVPMAFTLTVFDEPAAREPADE